MALLTGFSRPGDPISAYHLSLQISTDISKTVNAVVLSSSEITVEGSTISESDRTNIQNSIDSYSYTGEYGNTASLVSGKVPTSQLGGSGADNTKYLRGDQTWTAPTASAAWGSITGTLSAQTDLQASIDAKQTSDSDLTAIAALSPTNDDVIQRKAGAWTNRTMAQVKTDLALVKGDVGLGNVDNTSDASKPISSAQQTAIDAKVADAINDGTTTIAPSQNAVFDQLALKAPLASPTFTGTVTVPDVSFNLAKLANMATASLIYRKTAGTGAPEVNSLATLKTDLGLTGTNSGDQTISDATITTTDVTTNNVTTAKHGFAPKGTNLGKFLRDDATYAFPLNNFSTASQTPTAATLTKLTGSTITIPTWKMSIGTMFRWTFDITKTAAGTATSAYHVRVGTANSTSDAAILTFTKPIGTAAIDTGLIEIVAIVRGPLSASCVMTGTFRMTHNLSATGHATIPAVAINVVSSTFDATVANLFVNLTCTTGASDAITTQLMMAEALNL